MLPPHCLYRLTYDLARSWKHIKLTATAEGDVNSAERTSVPRLSLSLAGQQPVGGMVKAFPAPGQYASFQWQVFSELHQLATKYGLGSPAVASML